MESLSGEAGKTSYTACSIGKASKLSLRYEGRKLLEVGDEVSKHLFYKATGCSRIPTSDRLCDEVRKAENLCGGRVSITAYMNTIESFTLGVTRAASYRHATFLIT